MSNLGDLMARGEAAGGMMRDIPAGPPPTDTMETEETGEQAGTGDLDAALAQVESAVEGLNPDIADQVRDHLNAIRELVASAPEAKSGPDQAAAALGIGGPTAGADAGPGSAAADATKGLMPG